MEVTIRPFRMEDYNRVIELWQACGLPLKPKGRDSREEINRQLQLPQIIFLVAEVEGRVIGTILASHDGRKGWINRLAVDPSYRGRGLARELVRRAEQELEREGLRMFAALIEEDNLPSIRLFEKLGYVYHPEIKYFTRKSSPDI
ncbi:MAG: GNAT family N-acetyltransferase [Candidatus Saccharicenans sp.]|uniref:GNAT family N-acetyltransferase n=1 Tax=Candidatus Saccharicenans sp. TaxID=2819258 RepID=UPI0040496E82